MNLINEWKHAWKLFSVQANAIGASIVLGYSQLPSEFKAAVPQNWVLAAAGVTFVLGMLGRIVAQPDVLPKQEDPK